jgi:gas vesicle protein
MTNTYKPQGRDSSTSPRATDLGQQARALTGDLKNKASELTETMTRTAKNQAANLGDAAKDLASDATGRVKTAMDEQKAASADYLGTIAQAVQRAAGEFQSDVPQAAQYIRQAASQISSVADAVRDRNMHDLVGEVQNFAKRQPTLFFGGAVVLGFAALRFLKSSAPASSGASPRPDGSGFTSPGTQNDQWRALGE